MSEGAPEAEQHGKKSIECGNRMEQGESECEGHAWHTGNIQ